MDTSTSTDKQTIDVGANTQYVCSKKPANKGAEFPVTKSTNHSPVALVGRNGLCTFNAQLCLKVLIKRIKIIIEI
jgi:hypothetical protein